MNRNSQPTLILASTSRYRHELLSRLRLPFVAIAPQVDETPAPGEASHMLAQRLARAKAQAVSHQHPQALVIGSDQVAELEGGQILGKPGDHERAVAQLKLMRGQSVRFYTAVTVCRASDGYEASAMTEVRTRVRHLSDAEIEFYLRTEQPYDCAGSAKAEGLGIALLDAIESDDPTALIGLPLIRTSQLLRAAGLDALSPAHEKTPGRSQVFSSPSGGLAHSDRSGGDHQQPAP
jgi:septum formation protein